MGVLKARVVDDWFEVGQSGVQGPAGEPGIEVGPTPPADTDQLWADTTADGSGMYVDPFNVHTYGAVGDGVTDDTVAIQAAINACSAAGGGVVSVPCNDYLVTATLIVPSYVSLQGDALPYISVEYGITGSLKASALIHGSGSSFTMLRNADPVNGDSSISISRLRFHATNEAAAGGTAPTIEFNKVRRSLLQDCHILGSPGSSNRVGIFIHTSSEHNALFNCGFDACGITVQDTNRMLIRECEIGAAGISLTNGHAHMIIDCDLYNDALPAGEPFPAYPNIITVNQVIGILIKGNQLTHATNHGMYLLDMKRSLIIGNEIKNSSRQVPNAWSGIAIDSFGVTPSADNVIANNVCWNEIPGSQAYGISVASSVPGLTNNNVFVSNVLTGNASGGANQAAGITNVWIGNTGTTGVTAALTVPGALDHDGTTVGFYGTTPVAKPTAVPVTAAGIHAALVALGLIGA